MADSGGLAGQYFKTFYRQQYFLRIFKSWLSQELPMLVESIISGNSLKKLLEFISMYTYENIVCYKIW